MFRRTCFGHIYDIKLPFKFVSHAVDLMLRRWFIGTKFLVNRRVLELTVLDFVMILGLKIFPNPPPTISNTHKTSTLKSRWMVDVKEVCKEDLLKTLKRCTDDADAVRIALLIFLEYFLLGVTLDEVDASDRGAAANRGRETTGGGTGFAQLNGGSHFKESELRSTKLDFLGSSPRLAFQRKSNQLGPKCKLFIRSEYNDGTRGGGSDFLAGFLVGGAVFGTLAYVVAPQIRRSLLNEDEYGIRRAKRPIYYDEGLEKTRQTLNAKISQLNSAIDNASSRLRGGNNAITEPIETDSQVEASM
ncbi:hypothetical protein HHK36_000527 [Tetracentron sinense]|uniref:Uncharacterized protein n=1 Tax=Tetracentron sinense TaxID=13715 RepID=A0A834ZR72_TETSI|nr:hypothetical protein HHK36_000527 [Tetracentron sinense]